MDLNLHPGYTLSGKQVTWSGADNPHLYISGQSGTGKSFLMKKLAFQAADQGACVLALDYSSDYLDYTPPDGLYFQRLHVSSPEFSLNPLIGHPSQTPDARAQQLLTALRSVFRAGSTTALSLYRVTTTYLTADKHPTIEGLLTFIAQQDKPDRGIKSAGEYLELLTPLTHCGSQPISLDLDTPGLTVLDYSQISDRSLCKLLVELILQAVWTAHTPQHPPLILILDEAQQLHWGADSMSIRILREGRKFGIAGWFSSQWCEDKEAASALGQAACQIHFRPDSQHISKLAKSMCSRPADIPLCQKSLRGLRRGQFLWQRGDGKVVMVNVKAEEKGEQTRKTL